MDDCTILDVAGSNLNNVGFGIFERHIFFLLADYFMLLRSLSRFLATFTLVSKHFFYLSGPSSLGVPGVPWHTQILADQLSLFSTRGDRLCPPNYYWHPRIFRPSYGPGNGKNCWCQLVFTLLM